MRAVFLIRISSQVIAAIMGGITVFFLYYAAQSPIPIVLGGYLSMP